MADVNLKAWVGPDDNGKFVTITETVDASNGYASALKFSMGLKGLALTAEKVIGGHDGCIDINNFASLVDVVIAEAVPTGQFVATTKGDAHDTLIHVKKLSGHGKVCDFIYGDWSDQSHSWSINNTLIVNEVSDGKPVTVIVLAADFPVTVDTGVTYKFLYNQPWYPKIVRRLISWGFLTLRRWGFFRSQWSPP